METQTLVKEICPTSTKKWIAGGALLVDVREPEEVVQLSFDVPEILLIPLSEFESRYHEIPRDRKVVLVCKSGARSLRAAGFLVNHGYDMVANMQFGLIRWVQKGFPTIGNTDSVLTIEGDCCSKPGCC
jgi:rhodanese-related sulfurtransferase